MNRESYFPGSEENQFRVTHNGISQIISADAMFIYLLQLILDNTFCDK